MLYTKKSERSLWKLYNNIAKQTIMNKEKLFHFKYPIMYTGNWDKNYFSPAHDWVFKVNTARPYSLKFTLLGEFPLPLFL